MLLTDEEKRAIRAKVKEASGEWHFDLMMFANEIERAVLANASQQVHGEPDFSHPKLQALLGKNARQSIHLGIYEKILDEDFDGELSGIDCEYMESGHEKLLNLRKASPAPKQEPVGYTSQSSLNIVEMGIGIGNFVDEKLVEFPIPIYLHLTPPQASAIPESLCIDENLKRLALDYVRCGIGANYSRESFEDRMREIYYPFRKIIDLIPLSASPKP